MTDASPQRLRTLRMAASELNRLTGQNTYKADWRSNHEQSCEL